MLDETADHGLSTKSCHGHFLQLTRLIGPFSPQQKSNRAPGVSRATHERRSRRPADLDRAESSTTQLLRGDEGPNLRTDYKPRRSFRDPLGEPAKAQAWTG